MLLNTKIKYKIQIKFKKIKNQKYKKEKKKIKYVSFPNF